MKPTNMKTLLMLAVAFVIGGVIVGSFIYWKASQRDSRAVDEQFTREQKVPIASQPESRHVDEQFTREQRVPIEGQSQPTVREVPSTPSRSVIINGKRLSDQDIETLARTFQVQARDGRYWYDRMNGSWGREGGPAEGFIMAGLNLGGPLREDASHGDTGVFINGRQLHRVDVARLMQLGPVNKGRCWMDAYGNIGLEGQPAFGNVWVAAARAQGGVRKKEGILSTYDKTGIAVFGY